MVSVFQEVKRVLRDDGTVWLNLGDSYGQNQGKGFDTHQDGGARKREAATRSMKTGLKPKDLCGIPWRVAFALQDDGWFLRSDIIWSKPNPMPESVTDRPTNAHEHVFLLSKSATYFYDNDAIREPYHPNSAGRYGYAFKESEHKDAYSSPAIAAGRNSRNVWQIPTEPFPDAHFATYPQELVRRCVAAGTSEKGCCPQCGAPWGRVVERDKHPSRDMEAQRWDAARRTGRSDGHVPGPPGMVDTTQTIGWEPGCDCVGVIGRDAPAAMGPIEKKPLAPCTVLDCFAGSGTTLAVACRMGRDAIGIELNPTYAAMAEKRIGQALRPNAHRSDQTTNAPLFEQTANPEPR